MRRPHFQGARLTLRLAAVLSLLLVVTSDLAAERLPLKRYSAENGLPHNRIVEDLHGFLWFCTAGGLSRFDGRLTTRSRRSPGSRESWSIR